MGGSSKQTIGYQYFSFFLLFIGNPIEKMLGINFDKRGWHTPLIDEMGNPLSVGVIEKATLYGENEGGVAGQIHARYGTDNQEVVSFYKEYMESKGLQASAYPFQSYLAFPDFYLGNSGYMKEMLLWPKRIHVRNDGRGQWHDLKAEIPDNYIDYTDTEFKWTMGFYKSSYKGVGTTHGYNSLQIQDSEKARGVVDISKKFETNMPALFQIIFSSGGTLNVPVVTGGELIASELIHTTQYAVKSGHYYIAIPKGVSTISLRFTFDSNDTQPNGWLSGKSIAIQSAIPKEYSDPDLLKGLDINPIHKIREILTDDTAMSKPESSINDENFMKAADRIWDEGLGVSWSITEKSCIDAINELCYHIEAGIRVNRQTGLYEMVLFRDDWFEENAIHAIAESKIKSMQYEITNADEVINQVNVNYYDRANIKNSSFSISENGLIQTLERVNAETLDFPYFMNMRNAEIVANWKLKQLSTGAFKGAFTTGWREARKWNRYDLIRLPWSKRWTGTILVRIMSINLGGPTNNEVSIEYIEVVPSTGMMNTSIVADEPIDKPLPPQACEYEPFEMPYYLAAMRLGQRQVDEELAYESNFGLVGVVAEQPQSNSLYAIMKTHNGVEGEEWQRAASIQYSETADLDQIISRAATSFTVKNWKKIANVPVGTLIQCGKEWLTGFAEWMVFQGIDPYTGIVSVKRGALDTQPQQWDLGLKLYFCGTDVAYDATEYVAGEKVLVSALTTTPSGVLDLKGSNQVEMKARAIRPYPPTNVKFNGVYFPETQIVTNNITLTWAHRNRLQQTGGEIIGWYEGDVTAEDGVTYAYELISENLVLDSQSDITANTVTILASVLKPNKPHTLKLWSIRDSYESYQKFEHSFFVESIVLILTATATKDKVSGSTLPSSNITLNIDESLSANIKSDGFSVVGKAEAGSLITIEVEE